MEKRKTKLPPLPEKSPGVPKGIRYKEQFGVIVICRDETHHREVFEDLSGHGYTCKVVRT